LGVECWVLGWVWKLLLSSIAFSIFFFNLHLPHPLSPSPKREGGTEFENLSVIHSRKLLLQTSIQHPNQGATFSIF
jgi:hypothetical protein